MLIILSKVVGLGGLLTLFVITASTKSEEKFDQSTLPGGGKGGNLRGLVVHTIREKRALSVQTCLIRFYANCPSSVYSIFKSIFIYFKK